MKSIRYMKTMKVLALAAALPLVAQSALAGGSHSGGHGHEKKGDGHGHMKKEGHGHGHMKGEGHGHMKKGHGHGHAKIDYSSVEEHEFGKASDPAKAGQTIMIDMTDKLRFEPEAA